MTSVYQIPLTPNAQHFDVTLNGTNYEMRLVWNSIANCWVLDLSDTSGNPIAQGLPLIDGADILQQLNYLGIGGALMVDVTPSYASLGTAGQLFFLTP